MMLILTVLAVFVLLVISEIWWRVRKPRDEVSRKFIHITVGSFAAFWPYFLSWNEIVFLGAAFVVAVGISQYFGIFKAIHAVERPTWGEVCFAAAVGLLAVVAKEPAIYTVALLHMSLADGLAAIVGTAYGKKNSYKIFGHTKSIAGSLAFLTVSLFLLITFATLSPIYISPAILVAITLIATGLENIAVRGIDNLFVPLFVAAALMAVV